MCAVLLQQHVCVLTEGEGYFVEYTVKPPIRTLELSTDDEYSADTATSERG